MSNTIITGAKIFDASGAAPFDGDVLIEGKTIAAVRPRNPRVGDRRTVIFPSRA